MREFPSADVANCYLIAKLRSVYRRSVQDFGAYSETQPICVVANTGNTLLHSQYCHEFNPH
jgi:hypothetical protein